MLTCAHSNDVTGTDGVAILTACYPLVHLVYGWLNQLKSAIPTFCPEPRCRDPNDPGVSSRTIQYCHRKRPVIMMSHRMCARQHTFHSRGSLLPTRDDTDGVPRIQNPQLPISVLEITKNEVDGESCHWPCRRRHRCLLDQLTSFFHLFSVLFSATRVYPKSCRH